jgi:hypothetical protein
VWSPHGRFDDPSAGTGERCRCCRVDAIKDHESDSWIEVSPWECLSPAFGRLRSIACWRTHSSRLRRGCACGVDTQHRRNRQLPIYNQDRDENPRPQWIQLRERIKAAAAVLFVTLGYHRSVPAALKNALDVGSRPYGNNVWSGKLGAVSASPGAVGVCCANHHLRQSLVFLNVPAMPLTETRLQRQALR